MGKLAAAFVFFLGASALAIHEAKPPPPPSLRVEPAPDERVAPPSRAIHDEVPPWVKYATPPTRPTTTTTVAPTRTLVVTQLPPRVFHLEPVDNGDIPDVIDRCPDEPVGRDGDDDDGCPEPEERRQRVVITESEITIVE